MRGGHGATGGVKPLTWAARRSPRAATAAARSERSVSASSRCRTAASSRSFGSMWLHHFSSNLFCACGHGTMASKNNRDEKAMIHSTVPVSPPGQNPGLVLPSPLAVGLGREELLGS